MTYKTIKAFLTQICKAFLKWYGVELREAFLDMGADKEPLLVLFVFPKKQRSYDFLCIVEHQLQRKLHPVPLDECPESDVVVFFHDWIHTPAGDEPGIDFRNVRPTTIHIYPNKPRASKNVPGREYGEEGYLCSREKLVLCRIAAWPRSSWFRLFFRRATERKAYERAAQELGWIISELTGFQVTSYMKRRTYGV